MTYCEAGHEGGTLEKCVVCKCWFCMEHLKPRQKHNCKGARLKKDVMPTAESLRYI